MKQSFFSKVREFVVGAAVEPRTSFTANNLSVEVGNFEFSIEGRNRGTGYCVVRENGAIVASESPLDPLFNERIINWRIIMILFGGAKPGGSQHPHLADSAGICSVCRKEVA